MSDPAWDALAAYLDRPGMTLRLAMPDRPDRRDYRCPIQYPVEVGVSVHKPDIRPVLTTIRDRLSTVRRRP